jgi:hypothetical protein
MEQSDTVVCGARREQLSGVVFKIVGSTFP